jgi:hypothetical protein
MNSKGQISNYAAGVFFIFLFTISIILAAVLLDGTLDAFENAGYLTGQAKAAGDGFWRSVVIYDYLIILIVVAVIIATGVTSFKINSPPVFFIVTLILGSFLGFMSYILNYVFTQWAGNSAFSSIIGLFPRTVIVGTNLHWIALILMVIGSITLYAKKEKPGVGGGFVE